MGKLIDFNYIERRREYRYSVYDYNLMLPDGLLYTRSFIVIKNKLNSIIRFTDLHKYIALFLCTLIEKERFKYSYGRKFGLNKIKNSKIKLPVTKDNKPDWEFMENYINQLPYADHLLKSN